MRQLFSANTKCTFGCEYCFTKWNGTYANQPMLEIDNLSKTEAIIYPCCDGEFFDQKNSFSVLKSISEQMDKVYISISTKKKLDPEMLSYLSDMNSYLITNNKGFVKFSVSVSNKSRISEIEPGTLTYGERLEIISRLVDAGIPTSLTLKPILPFIPTEEYFSILDDFSVLVNRMLLGGLYVCPNTPFFSKYIDGKYVTTKREVSWLANKPHWDYVVDQDKYDQIRQYAATHNILLFNSDIDIIKSIKTDL